MKRKCRVCRVCRVVKKAKSFCKNIQPKLLKLKSNCTLHPTLHTLPYTATFFCKYPRENTLVFTGFASSTYCTVSAISFFIHVFLEILNLFSTLNLKFELIFVQFPSIFNAKISIKVLLLGLQKIREFLHRNTDA